MWFERAARPNAILLTGWQAQARDEPHEGHPSPQKSARSRPPADTRGVHEAQREQRQPEVAQREAVQKDARALKGEERLASIARFGKVFAPSSSNNEHTNSSNNNKIVVVSESLPHSSLTMTACLSEMPLTDDCKRQCRSWST